MDDEEPEDPREDRQEGDFLPGGSWLAVAPPVIGSGVDAPMDEESNRFFWRIAIGVILVGVVYLVLILTGH